ncbi:TPA: CPBP family intramembrane metalloprotease [Staphylococcus delphini]|nr:CPBP family intramembrane metalloprotease [Staphylococcus delphini]
MRNPKSITTLLHGFNIVIVSYLMLFITSMVSVFLSQDILLLHEIENKYIVLYTQIALPMLLSLILLPVLSETILFKNNLKSLGFSFLQESKVFSLYIYIIFSCIYIILIYTYEYDTSDILLLSIYVFIQCFGEEILFRSVIQRRLHLIMDSKWAVLIGTIIFVFLFHEDSIVDNLLFRTPIAILLSFTYYKTKSIYPTTVIHFVYNMYYSI